ncbi:MAG: heavy metal-binding domain-containing protein [Lachnospiraceae bacterium]|nr:heavy metal-binding domain-containing protein [Lachnospiraceae bacterium]
MALSDLFGHGKDRRKKRRKHGRSTHGNGDSHPDMQVLQKEAEEAVAEQIERAKKYRDTKEKARHIPITTGDLHQPYEILGPVYYQISNKGFFSNALDALKDRYQIEIDQRKKAGIMSDTESRFMGPLSKELSVGQEDFESAFFIATEELKFRAALLGADAIVAMRQDIDIDTTGFSYFYLQMYGTAVKYKQAEDLS